MSFQPNPNDELTINGERYRIAEHPAAPGMPHGQEGRAGTVYHLLPSSGQAEAALKVFKPRFRIPHLVSQAGKLAAFASLPGLRAAQRTVLIPQRHAELLRQYPDLTYAVLMPWIDGPTWLEVVLDQRPFSPDQSLTLARTLANTLSQLEQEGLAHCDLSGPNLMLPALAGDKGIELIDLEGFYAPGMPQPEVLSSGSAGYAHQQASGGLWGPKSDRFAGAVLLAEMLGWCDPAVVEQAWGESYFDPAEMQSDCPRYHLLEASLRRHWGEATADLFRRAWQSEALAECPTFGEWLVALPQSIVGQVGKLRYQPAALPPEPPPSPAESIPLVAEIRAFLQAARRMEERGNLDGALETYRQALELAQSDPSLRSMANEIALTIQEVEASRPTGQQPPAPAVTLLSMEPGVRDSPLPPAGEGPGVRAPGVRASEPRPPRKRLAWGWVIGLIGLLLLLGFGLQQQAEQRAQIRTLSGHTAPVWSVAFSPDGALLASGSVDNTVRLWRVADGALMRTLEGHTAPVRSVAFSPDGRLLASGSDDRTVRLWRVADGALRTLEGHTNYVWSVAFSPDGALLASGSDDHTVRLWQVADGALVRTLGHTAQVWSVAFSPDGALLASGSADNTVRLWRVADGTLVRTLEGHTNVVTSVAFSPDGALLASGSWDNTVRLWRVADGMLIRTLGHTAPVLSLAFSPDGRLLASGSDDHTVRLWQVADGTLVRTLGHTAQVRSVAFSPDGTLLASGSDDGTVRLWGVR